MTLKSLLIPSGKYPLTAVDTWVVRWQGREDKYYMGTVPCVEVFVSDVEANQFAESLRNAFRLLHLSGEGTEVVVARNRT